MTLDLEMAFRALLEEKHRSPGNRHCYEPELKDCNNCKEEYDLLQILADPNRTALCDGCMHYHETPSEMDVMDLDSNSASIAQLCPTCKTFTDWAKKATHIMKDFIDQGFCVHCGGNNVKHKDSDCPIALHIREGEDQYGG